MSDGKTANDGGDIKDAEPVSKPANPGMLPKKEMTFSQQLFIWTMVILVGVVFGGVGTSFGQMGLAGRSEDGIDVLEIQRIERLSANLQAAINPRGQRGGELFELRGRDGQQKSPYLGWLRQAHLAFAEGYKPTAAVTEQLVKDFLARTVVASGQDDQGRRTYYDVLIERRPKERVSPEDLSWYLSLRHAREAMLIRRLTVPVVPTVVADEMRGLGDVVYRTIDFGFGPQTFPQRMPGDQVKIDQVVLSAQALAAAGPIDESEIQAAYDRLRDKGRFRDPSRVIVAVAFADLKTALEKAKPTAEQVRRHYDANKERYRKAAAAAPAPDPAKPGAAKPAAAADEFRPFDEVRAEIEDELTRKAKAGVVAEAQKLVAAFAQRMSDEGFDEKDQAAFLAAALKDGLSTREDVAVLAPAGKDGGPGTLEVPGLGAIAGGEQRARLFAVDNKAGFITGKLNIQGEDGTALVMRVNELRPAQVRPLSDAEVRKEITTYLAGRKAWDRLLTEAKTLREQAEKGGAGGLRKLFADPELKKKWTLPTAAKDAETKDAKDAKAKDAKDAPLVTEDTVGALTEFAPPPEQLDQGVAGAATAAAELAVPTWPVLLAAGDSQGDVPSVRLVQATMYVVPAPPAAERRDDLAQRYREYWFNYQQALIGREIEDKLKE